MITTAETYHVPVLLKESVDGLDIQPDGIYVDVTFGGGGHSKEILSRLGKKGHLYSFDQDVKFIGMDDTIEIWSNRKVEEQQMKPEDFGNALEQLMMVEQE